MASYGIGEVESLTGLPASTLRHWEKVLPLLDPRKDEFGRRFYSESDIRLIFRLKYLTEKRGLGLKAASAALVAESGGPGGDYRARLAELRAELIALYFESRDSARRVGKSELLSPAPPADGGSDVQDAGRKNFELGS